MMEKTLHSTLTTFAQAVLQGTWYGKEREAVSYYAFGFLAKACKEGTLLFDPGQLAIEGRIPATAGHIKKQVCKDLVIWSKPGMNCWEGRQAIHLPLAIMEWKVNSGAFFPYDIERLQEYTTAHKGLLGVAVTFDVKHKQALRAARVVDGVVDEDWLAVGDS